LVILGAADKNVPPSVTVDLQQWATESIVMEGYGHELQEHPPADEGDSYIPRLTAFVQRAVQDQRAVGAGGGSEDPLEKKGSGETVVGGSNRGKVEL
jgi:hypothetical protein